MKEFFDRLQDEAERRELPEPGELRARGDRRTARRGAAGAFSLAVVMAGGFIAARPLFHEHSPITAEGSRAASVAASAPGTISVPDVRGMGRNEAATLLMQQGFKVQVMAASPPPSGSPQAGKVSQQDPVAANRIPSETTVTIWVDPPEAPAPVCADKWPKTLPAKLFVTTETEICYADSSQATASEALPMPCPATVLASEALVVDRRGFSGIFDEEAGGGRAPTMLYQTISRYKGSGAEDYLGELSHDVEQCEPVKRGSFLLTYTVAFQAQQDKLGEQSLLINVEYRLLEKPEIGPLVRNYLVSVARFDLDVVVVYDKGWQGAPSKRETILGTAREILRRLTSSPSPSR